jgi:hypothetical protein
MSERRNDTTEPTERDAPPERERRPQNYYYDDGTGYEVYDPSKDDDLETGDEAAEGDS